MSVWMSNTSFQSWSQSIWAMLWNLFFRYKTIPLDAWHVEIIRNKITKINKSALYFCGFPTLKHIKHKVKDFSLLTFSILIDNYVRVQVSFMCCFVFTQFYLRKSGVQVFQQSSHGENMVLEIIADDNSKEQVSIHLLTKQPTAKQTKKNHTRQKSPIIKRLNLWLIQIWNVDYLYLPSHVL